MSRALEYATPPEWVRLVERRPLELLSDHAHNELKAASTAQAWLLKRPEASALVVRLARVAAEETEHFDRVVRLLYGRGGALLPLDTNPYADALLARSAATRKDRFLDRMVVAALIEARSCERFELLAAHLADAELRALYAGLVESEQGHRALFLDLVREHFEPAVAEARIAELFRLEGEVMAALPFAYRMHSGLVGAEALA
ncbi:MAG: tRNA-(ms[2]io[6]A)-hydroxylase [Planctomycetes bacterium]|nr:tRNA-(ms[2]io[6]A)-hydroxylase [Planctomycetota bacterium]